MNSEHEQRIFEELKSVGVTSHGLAKSESSELPHILHTDEHIGGVIYGRDEDRSSAMLVATDHRVLFLDNQFLFKTMDELTYDVVSGVSSSTAGPLTSITLHTRIADYTLRYVNAHCADIFRKYIETKCLEKTTDSLMTQKDGRTTTRLSDRTIINHEAEEFMKQHDLAVLSTVDRTGSVHGAVVHYTVHHDAQIYILTKSDTDKAKGIFAHSQVAMTIHEPGTLKTLQLQGTAEIETDQVVKVGVFARMTEPHRYATATNLPPVTQLHDGSFTVIKITLLSAKYHDYAVDTAKL